MKSEYALRLQQHELEKLYFYALKKTGSRHEAEDLAQEIVAQALFSLANGSTPRQFAGWLWGVARNCYAKWVKQQRRSTEWTDSGKNALELIADSGMSTEDILMVKESLSMLKRELSLLSSAHREITIAYYIEGESIPAIARKLKLPEGTIKRKLLESRKNLREGMAMARELGQRSFMAENITFVRSGSDGKNGSPWSYIQRKIPKNILIAAYRNPMSLEELCLDLGIAMPYMEEEVKLLVGQTLLKEVAKGRFETDFIIVDKAAQTNIFNHLERMAESFCPLLLSLLDEEIDSIRAIDFIGNRLSDDFLYWTLLPVAVDVLSNTVQEMKQVPEAYTDRPGNGKWDITGYEHCTLPYGTFVGRHSTVGGNHELFMYKINMDGLRTRTDGLYSHEVAVMAGVVGSHFRLDELSPVELPVIRGLSDRGFLHLNESSGIVPSFLVLTGEQYRELIRTLKNGVRFRNCDV